MVKINSNNVYRRTAQPRGMISYTVAVRETDLLISTELPMREEALNLTLECRRPLEDYLAAHPGFLTAMRPWPFDPFAPPIVKDMVNAAAAVGVGPMAAVAGAIAEYVGRGLLERTAQVIVENGGDIFLKVNRRCVVAVFAGDSPLSGRIGIVLKASDMPLGICTSSGKIGHSFSEGRADAVCVVSRSASLADAAATALANSVSSPSDLTTLPSIARGLKDLIGGICIMGEGLVAWGGIELTALP